MPNLLQGRFQGINYAPPETHTPPPFSLLQSPFPSFLIPFYSLEPILFHYSIFLTSYFHFLLLIRLLFLCSILLSFNFLLFFQFLFFYPFYPISPLSSFPFLNVPFFVTFLQMSFSFLYLCFSFQFSLLCFLFSSYSSPLFLPSTDVNFPPFHFDHHVSYYFSSFSVLSSYLRFPSFSLRFRRLNYLHYLLPPLCYFHFCSLSRDVQ